MWNPLYLRVSGQERLLERRLISFEKLTQDSELIRKIWSTYLRDERKYDKYGAIGKLLVIEEVFREQRVSIELGGELSEEYQLFANSVFPRTFYCEREPTGGDVPQSILKSHFLALMNRLIEGGLKSEQAEVVALEETAEKFCLPRSEVATLLYGDSREAQS